jgi:hypothetical protein
MSINLNIQETIDQIMQNLSQQAGDQYQIAPSYLSSTIEGIDLPITPSGVSPDLFIYDNVREQLTLVEIKGSGTQYDLPFATIPAMRNIQEAYKELNPNIVLVTAAKVPETLQNLLQEDNISLIQYANPEQTLAQLVSVLQKE